MGVDAKPDGADAVSDASRLEDWRGEDALEAFAVCRGAEADRIELVDTRGRKP